ncbi:hypothetical protein QIU18_06665 [Capnocytophaga canimorsus]|nr:hypothetical protein [Capnocytophaga canimorsus]WGU71461.1 hypothetical protein QIU18_06665 [Capnocytophaga canimorsus]
MRRIYILIITMVLPLTYCTKQETRQERYEVLQTTPTMLSGKGGTFQPTGEHRRLLHRPTHGKPLGCQNPSRLGYACIGQRTARS